MTANAAKKDPPAPVHHIIVVEKSGDLTLRLKDLFPEGRFRVTHEPDLDRVLERFEQTKFSILLITGTAFQSGEIAGVELLDVIATKSPATQTLFIALEQDIDIAMQALRAGSYQYALEPVSDEELRMLIETAIENRSAFADNMMLREQSDQPMRLEQLVGSSMAMQNVYRLIRQAASTDIPVLITGETGTGKDLVAEAIHTNSKRAKGPYIPVHLASIPNELLASELFGHEKGAFTGASDRRQGNFELARDGSIFLDEIGTVDELVQVSMLRVIEQQRFMRLGGKKWHTSNARIIAATNEDLAQRVADGTFREDLYFRLDVFRIPLPPLRDRHGDIPLLVDEFMLRYNREYNKRVQGMSPECVRILESYPWPGNVRELKNVLQRAIVVCDGETLRPEHLPSRTQAKGAGPSTLQIPLGSPLEKVEAAYIEQTLKSVPNRTEAARLLGISRKSLYNKIKRYGLNGG
jgi:DNA-binding NtrC family response regulator